MGIQNAIFHRTTILVGNEIQEKLGNTSVIIFGIGGVGSWCAESLVRSGISKLTIVDSDRVCITNCNRQIQATLDSVGEVKVDVLKQRLLSINPAAEITAMQEIYSEHTRELFKLNTFDFIIDCIDSLSNKVDLIRTATKTNAVFISSMGASLKIDPTKIKVGEFWNVKGCPLGSKIRKLIKKGEMPAKKFQCVFSDEVLPNLGKSMSCGSEACMCPKGAKSDGNPDLENHEWCSKKAVINGTIAHIPAIFGLTIAGLVIQEVYTTNLS